MKLQVAAASPGLDHRRPRHPGRHHRPVRCHPARFHRVTDLIEESLASPLTVARLAREIGVSASFLSRAFSAFCGQTPYDYILSRRLQRARRLIATTGGSLPEIALQAGFSSQSHMTSSMKARLGVSPSSIGRLSI